MYKTVAAYTIWELEEEVNQLMSEGWMPIGGVFRSSTTCFQAMVRV